MKAIIHSLHRTRQNFLWLLTICPTLNSLCLWQFAAFPSLSLNQQCSGSQRTAQAVNPGWRAAMDRACRRVWVWVQHSQRQWGTPGEKHFWEAVTFTSLKKKPKQNSVPRALFSEVSMSSLFRKGLLWGAQVYKARSSPQVVLSTTVIYKMLMT